MALLEAIGTALSLANSAKSLFSGGGGGGEGKSMERQYQYNIRSAWELPQYEVMGLRNAGLNPMLAVNKGIQSPPQITSAPGKDAEIATARQLAAASTANQAAQAKLYLAQAENVEADTQDKLLKPGETSARTGLLQAQKATELWGPENRKWATELLSAQYGKTVAEKDAISIWQRKMTEAMTANYGATLKILNEDLRSAKTKADVDEALLKIERLTSIGAEGLGAVSGLVSSAGGLKRALDGAKPRTSSRSSTSYRRNGKNYFNEETTSR